MTRAHRRRRLETAEAVCKAALPLLRDGDLPAGDRVQLRTRLEDWRNVTFGRPSRTVGAFTVTTTTQPAAAPIVDTAFCTIRRDDDRRDPVHAQGIVLRVPRRRVALVVADEKGRLPRVDRWIRLARRAAVRLHEALQLVPKRLDFDPGPGPDAARHTPGPMVGGECWLTEDHR